MPAELSIRSSLLSWLLFFLICFGLGYPILNRYDPGKVPGVSDAAGYADAVRSPMTIASYRIFVPALAKPFYWLAKGRVATWDPALFGLLVATSILTASTAVAIIAIGLRCGFAYATSLIGAMLFLLNFAVPNWNLSGYVDSGEAFFLVMVTWSLLSGRWYLLPLWAIPGSMSKETFAPFAFIFSLIWWLADKPIRFARLVWILALAILSCAEVMLSLSGGDEFFYGAYEFTWKMGGRAGVGFTSALLRCLEAREFWYTFIWLLPLGLLGIRRMDRRWIWATTGTFILALLFGAYNDARGNTTRALFNVAGPLMSLAVAHLLTRTKTLAA